MKYNIYEDFTSYVIKVNVGGFSKDELFVSKEGGLINIIATAKDKLCPQGYNLIKSTFKKDSSGCEIYLSNSDYVTADCSDGILKLVVSKKHKGEKIEIN